MLLDDQSETHLKIYRQASINSGHPRVSVSPPKAGPFTHIRYREQYSKSSTTNITMHIPCTSIVVLIVGTVLPSSAYPVPTQQVEAPKNLTARGTWERVARYSSLTHQTYRDSHSPSCVGDFYVPNIKEGDCHSRFKDCLGFKRDNEPINRRFCRFPIEGGESFGTCWIPRVCEPILSHWIRG